MKTFKKIIFSGMLILGMLFLDAPAKVTAANITNLAVQGQVMLAGLPADGAIAVLTDARTGATLTDTVGTTGNSGTSGWYLFDLINLAPIAIDGDTINIVVTQGSNAGSTSFTASSLVGFVNPATINMVSTLSSAKDITALSFASPATTGVISGTNIALTVPNGTNVTALVPTIVVSPNATVAPLSGVAQDFTNPVTYTVTAQDLTTQTYVVTVNVAAPVTTFTLTYTAGANGSITGTSPQTVNSGADGSTVTAVANAGFHFVSWSDGVLTAARTDLAVAGNISVTANFAADATVLTSIRITPLMGNPTFPGLPVQIIVFAVDAIGWPVAPQPTLNWSSSAPAVGTISATGLFTPLALGATTITATDPVSGLFGTRLVTVVAPSASPVLTAVNIAPLMGNPTFPGLPVQISALAVDATGWPMAVQPALNWNSSAPTVGTISATGLFTPLALGATTITATDPVSGLFDTILVDVVAGAPVCQTGADTSGDGIISMSELLSYIAGWKIGNVTMTNLLKAIGFWKVGTGC